MYELCIWMCILFGLCKINIYIYFITDYRLSESNLYGAERIQQLLDEIKALNVKIGEWSVNIIHINSEIFAPE